MDDVCLASLSTILVGGGDRGFKLPAMVAAAGDLHFPFSMEGTYFTTPSRRERTTGPRLSLTHKLIKLALMPTSFR